MSFIVTNAINPSKIKKPIVWIKFSVSAFTGLPLIFSITKNNILPPSKAGNGIKLTNPTLSDNNASK